MLYSGINFIARPIYNLEYSLNHPLFIFATLQF